MALRIAFWPWSQRNAGPEMPADDAQRAAAPVTNPADYVNPMIGTGVGGPIVGAVDMSPAPSAPFGMIQWGPDTRPSGVNRPVGYAYADSVIDSFTLTRSAGPRQ